MANALKLFLLLLVIVVFASEAKPRKKGHYGLLGQGWSWNNWYYYWYYRHGKSPSAVSERDTICQQLWNADSNRFHQAVDYDIFLQQNVSDISRNDRSHWPLFRYVKEDRLRRRPTYDAFLDVLSNFNPSVQGSHRSAATATKIKQNVIRLVDEVVKTRVFFSLYWFLVQQDLIKPNKNKFKQDLLRIWFDNNITYRHISAFENVFVGKTVNNPRKITFRNWLQFYSLEKNAQYLNYHGYIRFYDVEPKILSVMYSWRYGSPVSDNMFLGTTPEFELALYTLCFYLNRGKECECKLNLRKIVVKTVTTKSGSGLQNAFFDIKS